MNEIIYKGLKLQSRKCKYFQFKEGKIATVVEDSLKSLLTITYSPGMTTKILSEVLGIERVGGDYKLSPIDKPLKFIDTYLTLNGLRLKKLTYDTHIVNIVIVSDSESRVVQDYDYTTIVVSSEDYKNQDFINYLFFSGNLKFLQPIGPKPKGCWEIRNFPKIRIDTKDITLESNSETIYQLRRRYNDYVIREIDYQDQFILEVRRILEDYGVELVRINKEKTLEKPNYVTYQFIQTPTNSTHPYTYLSNNGNTLLNHTVPVEFVLHCKDTVIFFDFKNKYMNVDLLTNFCTFYTTDKYGKRWSAGIKWGRISEDFNHQYQPDDNSNFALQCQFRAELYFTEAIDDRYEFLEEIIVHLEENNS